MAESKKPELDAFDLPLDHEQLRAAAVLMKEKLDRINEAEEAKRRELEEQAKAAPPDPLVRVEWLKSPQRGSCQIQSKAGIIYYRPKPHRTAGPCTSECRHGPVIQKATGRTLRPGTSEQVPADHARILAEGQFVRVTEGFDLVRWSPMEGGSGIDTRSPDPSNESEWAALAHS